MKLKFADGADGLNRFLVLGLLILAMFIPLAFVDGVTEDRQRYFEQTMADVARAWGGEQTLNGPYLIVPENVLVSDTEEEGGEQKVQQVGRVVVPAELDLEVEVVHQMRHRALYEVPVYTAVLKVRGVFPALDRQIGITGHNRLIPAAARVALGISHTRAIANVSELTFADQSLEFESGSSAHWLGSGIHALPEGYDGSRPQPFQFEIEVKGTGSLGLTPVGGTSSIAMNATWPHPSFDGQYLPESYHVRSDGFSADWTISQLARDLPDSWLVVDRVTPADDLLATVRLFQPVTGYKVVDRAIKYGVLFIALTFITFICFELTLGFRIHPVQYGVVGLALVLFYLTLLSLSEHLPFGAAYGLATALLTGMIAAYVRSLSGSVWLMAYTAAVIGGLYGVLFVLLKLETFALLVGTAVLLIALGGLMFATRALTYAPEPELAAGSVGANG